MKNVPVVSAITGADTGRELYPVTGGQGFGSGLSPGSYQNFLGFWFAYGCDLGGRRAATKRFDFFVGGDVFVYEVVGVKDCDRFFECED